jgi:uncharacterized protein
MKRDCFTMKQNDSAGRLSLEGLESGPREWSGELPTGAEFWSTDELDFIDPPMLEARVESSADGSVHVTGRLAARVRMQCRRCLEDLEIPLDIPLDLWFDAGRDIPAQEDGVFHLDPNAAELDLVMPLREEVLLTLPEYAECKPACRGYCPKCGANLDDGACECDTADPDPRWNVLRETTEGDGP